MSTRETAFISADDLRSLLGRNELVVLDVRFQPVEGAQPAEYAAGHIPGAVFVDLPAELAGPGGGNAGRYPLPAVELLQAFARRWGVSADSTVVVYDDRQGLSAARAWWVLTWAGVPGVRVLDGGYSGWLAGGNPSSTAAHVPATGDVTLSPGHLDVIGEDDIDHLIEGGVLLDVRSPRQYEGDPDKPATGHIPGAVNVDSRGNVDERGLLLAESELRERYGSVGADGNTPIAAYCGGGVVGAHTVLVLSTLGLRAGLYPGSWSAWSTNSHNPITTGPLP
ncbi:sulfurtransferase [Planctomonas sp. JC2975]|uniref:sulfurtransferase n=1 Tax=Planctomonas sp. JC2975 TaxID=2729626 RepID=UPI001472E19A|nr:sulfurtransferase [Planctomonas sp. JC2975]NNC12090.1 sulfurtransferase [Planctomonas sp. JC2975]